MFFRRHSNLTEQQRESHVRDRRVHLANERTFLAWIRTSISIMAFGLVVDKFVTLSRHSARFPERVYYEEFHTISDILGIGIVLLGCLTGILALIHYIRTEQDIEKGKFSRSFVLDMLFLSIFLTLAAFLALHLLNTRMVTGLP